MPLSRCLPGFRPPRTATASRIAARGTVFGLAIGLAGGILLAGALAAGPAVAAPEGSGLPLPRFVSLRAGEVNMRAGPGLQYPVEWVYRKKGLPFEIVAEHHHWRKVRDIDGDVGWIHKSLLTGRRTAAVVGEARVIRAKPGVQSPPVAQAEPRVVGRVLVCPGAGGPCRIDFGEVTGWIEREALWGVYPDESIE